MRFSLANIMSLYCGWWFLAAYGRPCQLEEPKLWCHITLYWGWFEMAGAGLGWAGLGWAGLGIVTWTLDTIYTFMETRDQHQPGQLSCWL